MPSPLESLCGPGKPLAKEPPDAREFAGLKRSALACLKDAGNPANSLESRFDLTAELLARRQRIKGQWGLSDLRL